MEKEGPNLSPVQPSPSAQHSNRLGPLPPAHTRPSLTQRAAQQALAQRPAPHTAQASSSPPPLAQQPVTPRRPARARLPACARSPSLPRLAHASGPSSSPTRDAPLLPSLCQAGPTGQLHPLPSFLPPCACSHRAPFPAVWWTTSPRQAHRPISPAPSPSRSRVPPTGSRKSAV